VSTAVKASRRPADDFDLKSFCIPRRHDDLADDFSAGGAGTEAFSFKLLDREGCMGGDNIEAVERAGEELVIKLAGVEGRGGGASSYNQHCHKTGNSLLLPRW